MRIERGSLKGFRGGWSSVPPKPCNSCNLTAAAVFCRSDSAFLCMACDNNIHCANMSSRHHERVWMCEACEQAPASVTCKADAASLCVTCDSDIHSANPLARRHERVPVEPFFDSAVKASAAFNFAVQNVIGSNGFRHHDGEVATEYIKSGEMFFSELDPFLDFDNSNSFQNNNHSAGNDSVVPIQSKTAPAPVMKHHHSEACFDIDFCRSNLSSFNYPTQSLSQSVSSSSLDVGVVPDGNSVSDISYNLGRNMSNSSDSSGVVSAGNSTGSQLCVVDREKRVLRYKEKKKNRKFEKTIRYASRKAYAETRPRIKGRFAKRTEIEPEVDRLYSPFAPVALMVGTQYGVVPSF